MPQLHGATRSERLPGRGRPTLHAGTLLAPRPQDGPAVPAPHPSGVGIPGTGDGYGWGPDLGPGGRGDPSRRAPGDPRAGRTPVTQWGWAARELTLTTAGASP
eukprot:69316-Pyramimonas_sp.AAC.1